jgi:BTB/POZ domain
MDSLAETHQSSPSNQQPNLKMTDLVCFNIGGNQYNLPHSFLKRHSQNLLGRIASEQWQANTGKGVFLDRNGEYFQFVLSYLRDDGHVLLPRVFLKSLFLDELVFFEIYDVDESKIVYDYHVLSTQSLVLMADEIESEIKSWDDHGAVATLSKKCVSIFMTTGGKLHFDICGPKIIPSFKKDNCRCSRLIWTELLSLVNNEEMKLLPQDEEKCNKFLGKIGLEIISVVASTRKSTIQVVMRR